MFGEFELIKTPYPKMEKHSIFGITPFDDEQNHCK